MPTGTPSVRSIPRTTRRSRCAATAPEVAGWSTRSTGRARRWPLARWRRSSPGWPAATIDARRASSTAAPRRPPPTANSGPAPATPSREKPPLPPFGGGASSGLGATGCHAVPSADNHAAPIWRSAAPSWPTATKPSAVATTACAAWSPGPLNPAAASGSCCQAVGSGENHMPTSSSAPAPARPTATTPERPTATAATPWQSANASRPTRCQWAPSGENQTAGLALPATRSMPAATKPSGPPATLVNS